ncbi:hypothetical protein B0H13DRAFT_1885174 [Mycena leptocephala]|nr:hypothetical protein B0H13DRAFT_1885174 [Mycena leptocephala]
MTVLTRDSLRYFTQLVSVMLYQRRGVDSEIVGVAGVGSGGGGVESWIAHHGLKARAGARGRVPAAQDVTRTRMNAECMLTAGGKGGLAQQDRRQMSASTDESSEYICGSGGMAQVEGQGYSERGALVAWRGAQGELWASANDAQASRKGSSQVQGKCVGRGKGAEDGHGHNAIDSTIPEGIGGVDGAKLQHKVKCTGPVGVTDDGSGEHTKVGQNWGRAQGRCPRSWTT